MPWDLNSRLCRLEAAVPLPDSTAEWLADDDPAVRQAWSRVSLAAMLANDPGGGGRYNGPADGDEVAKLAGVKLGDAFLARLDSEGLKGRPLDVEGLARLTAIEADFSVESG